jgi:hypothetical protein
MNSNLLGGGATLVFFGSVSPSSAATVDVTFAGTAQRSLIGLTADETAEFERLDRLSPVDHLGNCLWDFEGDPQTPDEKRWLVLYRRHEASSSTWPAAEGGPVGQTLRRRYASKVAPDRTAGKEVGCRAIPHCSTGWRRGGILFVAMLSTACIVSFAGDAGAQCSARDVLQNHLTPKKTPPANIPPTLIRSAAAVPVWKTITVGTFANSLALRDTLDAASCGMGNSAAEILARSTFALYPTKTDVELIAVSAAELGFQTDTASLASIYARAQQLGFELAAAEVAPQLRLQYFDQPIGEFLIIGMEPIKTWKGDPVILNVANGGAGLILIGQDGSADAEISVVSRFLFVRSNEARLAKAAHGRHKAAALVRHRGSRGSGDTSQDWRASHVSAHSNEM